MSNEDDKSASFELLRTLVEQHGGRAVSSRGDSLLAEFPSVEEAVQCAVEMRRGALGHSYGLVSCMLRQAQHARFLYAILGTSPFALSLSKGERRLFQRPVPES